MKHPGFFGLWLCLSLLVATVAPAELAVPPLEARVTDLTGTLTGEQRANLEARLQAFEQAKGSQIAVLLVPTTRPEAIEQYSIRVVDAWKLGREGIDDGALLLIAKDDRTLRIEVGYGLEGALTDATAKRIVSEVILPYFKRGDFYGGIVAGVEGMIRVIEGETLPPPEQRSGTAQDPEFDLFFVLIAALVGGLILRTLLGHLRAALLNAALIGLLTWFVTGLVLGAMGASIVAFFMVFLIGRRASRRKVAGGHYRRGRGHGGWNRGFGGGSAGGFGGGGGGFGGGGASGRW